MGCEPRLLLIAPRELPVNVIRNGTTLLIGLVVATGCANGVTPVGTHGKTPGLATAKWTRVAIRSTHSQRPSAAEVRAFRRGTLRAVRVSSSGLRLTLTGDGCSPRGVSAHIKSATLRLVFRPAHHGCTLPFRFYEVTVYLSKPVLSNHRVRRVTVQYRIGDKNYPKQGVVFRLS